VPDSCRSLLRLVDDRRQRVPRRAVGAFRDTRVAGDHLVLDRPGFLAFAESPDRRFDAIALRVHRANKHGHAGGALCFPRIFHPIDERVRFDLLAGVFPRLTEHRVDERPEPDRVVLHLEELGDELAPPRAVERRVVARQEVAARRVRRGCARAIRRGRASAACTSPRSRTRSRGRRSRRSPASRLPLHAVRDVASAPDERLHLAAVRAGHVVVPLVGFVERLLDPRDP
jgi:hypothetical protein